MKRVTLKIILSSAIILLLSGAIIPSTVAVAENAQTPKTQISVVTAGKEVLSSEIDLSEITLIDGIAYDSKHNIVVDSYGDSFKRGRLSWAVKAILKGYNKLPSGIKKIINRYTKINVILGLIDHFTGKVEEAVYWACKKVGIPSPVAWIVTKAITLGAL